MKSNILRYGLALGALIALGACQTPPDDNQISATRLMWEHTQEGCSAENCPLFNGDIMYYPLAPALNSAITSRLADHANPGQRFAPSMQLKEIEQTFLQIAEPYWENYIQAKERERHGPWIIVELSSYLFTGGAHGDPGRDFINYHTTEQRVVEFEEMLLPGQSERFWALAERAHRFWLHRNQLDTNDEYREMWPFKRTALIALLKDRVLLKYPVYAIAPYSSGHPELSISYQDLAGILDPKYLPKAQ